MSGGLTSETASERSRDVVPELPTSDAMAAAATGEAFHRHHSTQNNSVDGAREDGVNNEQASPSAFNARAHHRHHRRRDSSASRVAIDHFDPEGVLELKRTLTHQSATARSTHRTSIGHRHQKPKAHNSSGSSFDTAVGDAAESPEKFDLEKLLRDMVKRCVSSPSFAISFSV